MRLERADPPGRLLSAIRSLRLLEVGRLPDPLTQVVADALDVVLPGLGVPATAEPPTDAAPGVARLVVAPALDRVEPALVALVARAPDRVRQVRVHGGGVRDAGPGRLLVRVAVL